MHVTIRPLERADARSCEAIMRTLPDFFGDEGGLADCFEALRTQDGTVAVAEAGEIAGFATWTGRSPATAEITWMAIRRDLRHGGIGTAIVETLCAALRARGYQLALAMTSAGDKPPGRDDIYEATRRFWFARGFHPLIELDIWNTNYALLMVRPLGETGS